MNTIAKNSDKIATKLNLTHLNVSMAKREITDLGDNCIKKVYRWIYGRKFSFTATRKQSRKT